MSALLDKPLLVAYPEKPSVLARDSDRLVMDDFICHWDNFYVAREVVSGSSVLINAETADEAKRTLAPYSIYCCFGHFGSVGEGSVTKHVDELRSEEQVNDFITPQAKAMILVGSKGTRMEGQSVTHIRVPSAHDMKKDWQASVDAFNHVSEALSAAFVMGVLLKNTVHYMQRNRIDSNITVSNIIKMAQEKGEGVVLDGVLQGGRPCGILRFDKLLAPRR
jgi:hypothetical protein